MYLAIEELWEHFSVFDQPNNTHLMVAAAENYEPWFLSRPYDNNANNNKSNRCIWKYFYCAHTCPSPKRKKEEKILAGGPPTKISDEGERKKKKSGE